MVVSAAPIAPLSQHVLLVFLLQLAALLCLALLFGRLAVRFGLPALVGERLTFALFVGVAMSVSAIPVIAKTLADMRLLHRDIGQLTLIAGMVDDAVGWFGLALVSAMATSGLSAGKVGNAALVILLVVLFAVFAGRHLVRWALRLASRSSEDGPPIATAVVLIVLGAAATQWLSLEAVFGAFLVGMLIAGSVEPARLAPLRAVVLSVLAPLFLASAGLRIDLGALADLKVLCAALVAMVIAIAGKFTGAYLGARTSRMSNWEGVALGAGMNARGVVEVVVAMVGLRIGVLTTDTYTIVVLIAIITSLMAPPILRYAMSRVEMTADENLRQTAQAAWLGEPAPATGGTAAPAGGAALPEEPGPKE